MKSGVCYALKAGTYNTVQVTKLTKNDMKIPSFMSPFRSPSMA